MENNHKQGHSMLYTNSGLFVQFVRGEGDRGKYFPDTQAWPHEVLIYAKFIKSSCGRG